MKVVDYMFLYVSPVVFRSTYNPRVMRPELLHSLQRLFCRGEMTKHSRSSSNRTDFVTCAYCKRQMVLIVTLSAHICVCRKHYYYFFICVRLFARMHTRHRGCCGAQKRRTNRFISASVASARFCQHMTTSLLRKDS